MRQSVRKLVRKLAAIRSKVNDLVVTQPDYLSLKDLKLTLCDT